MLPRRGGSSGSRRRPPSLSPSPSGPPGFVTSPTLYKRGSSSGTAWRSLRSFWAVLAEERYSGSDDGGGGGGGGGGVDTASSGDKEEVRAEGAE